MNKIMAMLKACDCFFTCQLRYSSQPKSLCKATMADYKVGRCRAAMQHPRQILPSCEIDADLTKKDCNIIWA
jgi:hypothetical protein